MCGAGGREGERGEGERGGGGLAVILRVVGEGAAYPLTHFFLPSDSRSCVGGEGWGGGAGGQSKCKGDERGVGWEELTILTNVTDASDAKFLVCDPSCLS